MLKHFNASLYDYYALDHNHFIQIDTEQQFTICCCCCCRHYYRLKYQINGSELYSASHFITYTLTNTPSPCLNAHSEYGFFLCPQFYISDPISSGYVERASWPNQIFENYLVHLFAVTGSNLKKHKYPFVFFLLWKFQCNRICHKQQNQMVVPLKVFINLSYSFINMYVKCFFCSMFQLRVYSEEREREAGRKKGHIHT